MSTAPNEKQQFDSIVSKSVSPARRLVLSIQATWEDREWRMKYQRKASGACLIAMIASLIIGIPLAFLKDEYAFLGAVIQDEYVFLGSLGVAFSFYIIGYLLVPFEDRWAEANEEVG